MGSGKKSFIVAESENSNKSQTLTLKNVPNEYLENLITDTYNYSFEKNEWVVLEGYKDFRLLGIYMSKDSELKNINISNKNTKIAIILEGSIFAKGCGTMTMLPNDEKWNVQCFFISGCLVYSDSDCDITGYDTACSGCSDVLNYDIRLRKGWNKVFFFEGKGITSDDIKDSHLVWFNIASGE